jgi:ribosomal protein S18 acetylase RimI-like enzyme
MEITLKPILKHESDLRFSVVKEAIFQHVYAVFGWDDDFQRKRLIDEYDPTWFHWVYKNSQRIGLLCFKPYDNSYHVHLLIVLPDFQNQGLGHMTMDYVHQLAKAEQRISISLSSFIRNKKAVKFYKKIGYDITRVEKDFYILTRYFSGIE